MNERLSVWPAIVSATVSALFHTVHAAALFAAAGAGGLHAHAHHAQGHGGGAGWATWRGWGANVITLVLCIMLFVSYSRHSQTHPRRALSHLAAALVSLVVIAVTTYWSSQSQTGKRSMSSTALDGNFHFMQDLMW